MTPEERARQQVDLLLQQSGWIVQDRSGIDLSAGLGVAIRESLLKTGEAGYLISLQRSVVGMYSLLSLHPCHIKTINV